MMNTEQWWQRLNNTFDFKALSRFQGTLNMVRLSTYSAQAMHES
jgi:hypothetical protein